MTIGAGIGSGMTGAPWAKLLGPADPGGAPQVVFQCVLFGPGEEEVSGRLQIDSTTRSRAPPPAVPDLGPTFERT